MYAFSFYFHVWSTWNFYLTILQQLLKNFQFWVNIFLCKTVYKHGNLYLHNQPSRVSSYFTFKMTKIIKMLFWTKLIKLYFNHSGISSCKTFICWVRIILFRMYLQIGFFTRTFYVLITINFIFESYLQNCEVFSIRPIKALMTTYN